MQKLGDAFRFLTILGSLTAREPPPENLGRAATYFVLVGIVLGLLLALTNYLLQPHLDGDILAFVVISFWITATGARHLGGVRETFLNSRSGRVNETAALAAVVLVILVKSAAAESVDEIATSSLFLTPVLARWALLVFLYGYESHFDEITGRMAEQLRLFPVLGATAVTLGLVLYFLGRKGLWIALAVSICTLSLREALFRRRGVVLQSHLGASVEASETLTLVLSASL